MVSLCVDETVAEALKVHAAGEFPFECCGLLVGTNDGGSLLVTRVVRAINVAAGDRRKNYQIDWPTLFRVTRQTRGAAESIVGFYHSHPDGTAQPSHHDLVAAWDDTPYVIVPVSGGVAGGPLAWIKPAGAIDFQSVPVRERSDVPHGNSLTRWASHGLERLEPAHASRPTEGPVCAATADPTEPAHASRCTTARLARAARFGRPRHAGDITDADPPAGGP